MGFVQEIIDFFGKFSFYTIVNQYENGLYLRKGTLREKIDRGIKPSELENILSQERSIIKEKGWLNLFFEKPELPQGYKRDWYGRPLSQKRFNKILKPGLYFHLPRVDRVVTHSIQEKVLNLGYISWMLPDKDSKNIKNIMMSCNIRYCVMHLDKAYMAVDDYEDSLKDHTLSVLALKCRGTPYEKWLIKEEVDRLEKEAEDELKKIATDRWGLKIFKINITDITSCIVYKVAGDGPQRILAQAGYNAQNIE